MNIKEIREHYDLTQNQLANITGIPARTIGNWETGSRQPADYMPDLILAMIEQKKEDNMGAFDLGLAKCRAREFAEGVHGAYWSYMKANGIDWKDDTNQYVINADELWNMARRIDKCKTEDDINAVLDRITELRDLIK
ncbi:MAG: helix-turn-helix domain-containing protein [Acutalibacteraceae bacterium]|nr:helix-turn-helix domain-containing protein [Acutalibacteraceae bacterium]